MRSHSARHRRQSCSGVAAQDAVGSGSGALGDGLRAPAGRRGGGSPCRGRPSRDWLVRQSHCRHLGCCGALQAAPGARRLWSSWLDFAIHAAGTLPPLAAAMLLCNQNQACGSEGLSPLTAVAWARVPQVLLSAASSCQLHNCRTRSATSCGSCSSGGAWRRAS